MKLHFEMKEKKHLLTCVLGADRVLLENEFCIQFKTIMQVNVNPDIFLCFKTLCLVMQLVAVTDFLCPAGIVREGRLSLAVCVRQ